ncbi:hypothetical protein ACPA9J_00160 [Pseudomonas aeruginosa]
MRGIVEALDNIHDTSPHCWSTDLDDVHLSREPAGPDQDQAPARSEASVEEWLANELEGEDGQPVPAAVCDITLTPEHVTTGQSWNSQPRSVASASALACRLGW